MHIVTQMHAANANYAPRNNDNSSADNFSGCQKRPLCKIRAGVKCICHERTNTKRFCDILSGDSRSNFVLILVAFIVVVIRIPA